MHGAIAHLKAFLKAFNHIVSPSTADGLQNHMRSAVLNTLLKLHCVYFEKTKTYLVCEHTFTKIYKDATQASNIYLQMAFFLKPSRYINKKRKKESLDEVVSHSCSIIL